MMDRLAKSGLKAAVLIATSRCEDAAVTVETRDIIKAFTFVIDWRDYALEVAANAGVTAFEKRIQKIMTLIQKYPGVTRSIIMQRNALLKRDTDIILDTLEQRGSVSRIKHGRTEKIFPIEEP
jgi:ribosomal protein S25